LNDTFSGVFDDELDERSAGIDGVLHEFFDDGCGALHDFPGRNLIGYGIGEELDNVAHVLFLFKYQINQKKGNVAIPFFNKSGN
jgi:hypothetical protein